MKLLALALLLATTAHSPEIRHFRYERPVRNAAAGQTCAVLEPGIFAHAAPQLSDLRLYRGTDETPYVIRLAIPAAVAPGETTPLNLGKNNGQTVFDAQMPEGAYGDVTLTLHAHDFIAMVSVSGSQTQAASAATHLGDFTIFDLTGQKLGRSTVLHLPGSDFHFLHFRINSAIDPENVAGLTVERIASVQAAYQTVAQSTQVAQKSHKTEIDFAVPPHTPVDRILFIPGGQPANFSRNVTVEVTNAPSKRDGSDDRPPAPDTFGGNILRIHRLQSGRRLDEEQLTIDAPVRISEMPQTWAVIIENGDDAPISIASVRLEMVQRSLCFDAVSGGIYTLYYGDPVLTAPRYDYASLFVEQPGAGHSVLGPEVANSQFQPRADDRPFTERHPLLLWIALAVAIAVLGLVAMRVAKETRPEA